MAQASNYATRRIPIKKERTIFDALFFLFIYLIKFLYQWR